MREKFPLGQIVEVEWVDSAARGRWDTVDEYRKSAGVISCKSAGYVLRRDRRQIVLAQSQASNDSVSDTMAIPVCAVKRVRRLK